MCRAGVLELRGAGTISASSLATTNSKPGTSPSSLVSRKRDMVLKRVDVSLIGNGLHTVPATDAYPRSYRELGGRKRVVAAKIRFAVNSGVNRLPWCVGADGGVHRSLLFNAKQSPNPGRCSPAGSHNASAEGKQ